MSDPARYDGRFPEPPYPTEQEEVQETVFTLHVNEAWCENCGTISTDGKCHCTEDGFEPLWRPHDRKAIETIASLRQQLAQAEMANRLDTQAVENLSLKLDAAQARMKELEAVRLGSDGWPVSMAKHYAAHFRHGPPGAESKLLVDLISGAIDEAIEIAQAKQFMRIKDLEEAASQAWTCLLTGENREAAIYGLQSALAHRLRAALSQSAPPNQEGDAECKS